MVASCFRALKQCVLLSSNQADSPLSNVRCPLTGRKEEEARDVVPPKGNLDVAS
jgi:hypothetical protein